MTTWGGFALLVRAFIIPPIVLLHRSSIPSRWIWAPAVPAVTAGTYLGIFLGPVIFTAMLGVPEWPSPADHGIMLLTSFLFSLLMSLTLFVVKRQSEKEEQQRKEVIRRAIQVPIVWPSFARKHRRMGYPGGVDPFRDEQVTGPGIVDFSLGAGGQINDLTEGGG